MPHVIIKMYPGRSEEQKEQLVKAITKSVMDITIAPERVVSIAIEEIAPEEWPEKVYRPDILDKQGTIYKEPGYNPFSK